MRAVATPKIIVVVVVTKGSRKFNVLQATILCPLFVLAKVGWKQGKELGSEKGRAVGNGLLGVCSSGSNLSILAELSQTLRSIFIVVRIQLVPRSKHTPSRS